MVIVERYQPERLGGLVGRRGHGARRSLQCRAVEPSDQASRWVSEGTLHVTPGTQLAFRVDVGADEEVLWVGAREEGFTMRTSMATLCPNGRGTHVVLVEIYGSDGRLRDTLSVEVDVN